MYVCMYACAAGYVPVRFRPSPVGRGALRWEKATGLLADVWLAGLQPDCYTYSSAIHACAGAGRWEEAMSLLQVRGVHRAGSDWAVGQYVLFSLFF